MHKLKAIHMDSKPNDQTPTDLTASTGVVAVENVESALEAASQVNSEVTDELKGQMQEAAGSALAQPETPQPLPGAQPKAPKVIEQQASVTEKTNAPQSGRIVLVVISVLVGLLLIIAAIGVYTAQ